VEIFIGANFFFSPRNKARDLCFKVLVTISYILDIPGMHLKRKITYSITMFTGKVVIFKGVWFAEQLLFCLFAIVRVCFHKTKVPPSSFYLFKNSIELILLKMKPCDGTNISSRFQFLTTSSIPFNLGSNMTFIHEFLMLNLSFMLQNTYIYL